FLDTFVDRFDEFLRNGAADDLVLEDVAGPWLPRKEVNLRVAVLSAPAGLAHVPPFAVRVSRERFLVGDLRLADRRFDAELALHPVDDDFEMELAHAADDRLGGLLIRVDAEGRILRHQLAETGAELFLIRLRLRLDRERDDGLREIHRFEDDRVL